MESHSIDRAVLAENLYMVFSEVSARPCTSLAPFASLSFTDRSRWHTVAEYVLDRERQLIYKSGLKRAHNRIVRRIKARIG